MDGDGELKASSNVRKAILIYKKLSPKTPL
jgi:hypothetical protein